MNRSAASLKSARIGLAILLSLALATAAVVTSSGPPATAAATPDNWNAGFIVSDEQFYDFLSMSEADIQGFLESKVPVCQPWLSAGPHDPIVCLKDFRMNTETLTHTYCPGTYVGGVNERASTIIYKVAQACHISPKALLVTLQKEMGLVTHSWPSQWRYTKAMGFGCSDTAPCQQLYAGFQKQVFMAAGQFQKYRAVPLSYNHRAGQWNNVYFYPPNTRPECGSSPVFIQNHATAGLYNYTPYQPNAAAINAGYDPVPGDAGWCSSYGNRNFWRYWWDWFGNPQSTHASGWAVLGDVTETRVYGTNRYDTAVKISTAYAPGVGTVYVASGDNFPDALSAAPAAARQNAPLLLISATGIPATVATELDRLNPTKIVVVGGTSAVSESTFASIAGYAGSGGTVRIAGTSRYETSKAIVSNEWAADSTDLVYIASGRSFPDALSAAAAAGVTDSPVIVIDGTATQLDPGVAALITQLGAERVVIAGGTLAVSAQIATALTQVQGVTTVDRIFGSGRYATNAAMVNATFPPSTSAFIASGEDYPDALAGAARAGSLGVPLYIVPGSCIPQDVADSIVDRGATNLTVLGGPAAISQTMTYTNLCS